MTSKTKLPTNLSRHRNNLHDHPLLSKGGIHCKCYKSKRRIDKMKMKKEWRPQNVFLTVCFGESILTNTITNLINRFKIKYRNLLLIIYKQYFIIANK